MKKLIYAAIILFFCISNVYSYEYDSLISFESAYAMIGGAPNPVPPTPNPVPPTPNPVPPTPNPEPEPPPLPMQKYTCIHNNEWTLYQYKDGRRVWKLSKQANSVYNYNRQPAYSSGGCTTGNCGF